MDRLAELPYRLRPRDRATEHTWPIAPADLARIAIRWPTRYQWAPAAPIVETLKDGLMDLGIVTLAPIPQLHSNAIVLECLVDGNPYRVVVDYSDYHDFISEAALADCSLYFKGQFRSQGYADRRVVRGGYTVTGRDYYRYHRPFREQFAANRSIDVFGRFGFRFQEEIRRKAIDRLSAAIDLNFVGTGPKVRYSRFIREAASARLCLHLPGNGPFTHRVAEFLGVGSCLISIRFATDLHVPLVPGEHYVVVADDLSDLVETCRYYVKNNEERERIANNGVKFFDRYVHFDQLARFYVRTILDRLPGTRVSV